eukprot:CAMPEP_0114157072 /NCGR_PEP_ID=MMETSP0043_2-20121206/26415_1 /TAXON_ID=464988 /ORGANISM="Hemiselmis andersenii, Strain CCMP644" /LENGTH=37 /DNA_ID= /DNA_START= /DNA_END= /DNA_ORIENTATION=
MNDQRQHDDAQNDDEDDDVKAGAPATASSHEAPAKKM